MRCRNRENVRLKCDFVLEGEDRGWIGHTLRKPPANTTRQALSWNPQGKRRRGRPCNSWRRDTEAELKPQKLSWKGACDAAQNRVCWRGIVDGLCSNWSRPK